MQFYGWLTVIYLVAGLIWLALNIYFWKEVVTVQVPRLLLLVLSSSFAVGLGVSEAEPIGVLRRTTPV